MKFVLSSFIIINYGLRGFELLDISRYYKINKDGFVGKFWVLIT